MDYRMNKTDYTEARRNMAASQLRARGIHDPDVLRVMEEVPRHLFVPPDLASQAYEDRPLDIGAGQTISQPYMVALMTELLAIEPHHRVLEVGTGSGYQAAVLAALAREVITVERLEKLAQAAAGRLRDAGYANVRVMVGDGSAGAPDHAPFDRIIVTAGSPSLPPALKEQLAPGGRLVCPVGPRHAQRLKVVDRRNGAFEESESVGCVFVPLRGEQGWTEDEAERDDGRG